VSLSASASFGRREGSHWMVPGHKLGLCGAGVDAMFVHDLLDLLDEASPHRALFNDDMERAHEVAFGELPDVKIMHRFDV